MTVFQNVAFGPRLKGMKRQEIQRRVHEALRMVNLSAFTDRRPDQLSGGQQQRVAVARAVVNQPLVLLLDEPLSALDYKLRKAMQIELKQLQRQLGLTFVFVTHDQEEALSMSNRVVVMNEGRIEQVGEPREIYESPGNLFVAKFVGEINALEGTVLTVDENRLEVLLEGKRMSLRKTSSGSGALREAFKVGDPVYVLIMPQDLCVWGRDEAPRERISRMFSATVEEVIYKGATVDLVIRLENGKVLSVSRFFNEDDDQLEFLMGERVLVDWIEGWEVVLPHET
jgi:spermidine/putrescine transport system ATP-binding protein